MFNERGSMRHDKSTAIMTILGLMLMWPFFRANCLGDIFLLGVDSINTAIVFHGLLIACFVLISLFLYQKQDIIQKFSPQDKKKWCLLLSVGATLGCYVVVGAYNIEWISRLLIPFGMMLWTLGVVSLFAVWGEVLCKMSCRRMIAVVVLSFLLGSLLFQLGAMLSDIGIDDRLIAPSYVTLSALLSYFCPPIEKSGDSLHVQIDKKRMIRAIAIVIFFTLLTGLMKGYVLTSSIVLSYHPKEVLLYSCIDILFSLCITIAVLLEKNLVRILSCAWITLVGLFAVCLVLTLSAPSENKVFVQALLVVISSQLLLYFYIVILLVARKKEFNSLFLFSLYAGMQVLVGTIAYFVMPILTEKGIVSLVPLVVVSFILLIAAIALHYYQLLEKDRFGREPAPVNKIVKDDKETLSFKMKEKYNLTDREREVLVLLASGLTRKAIAEKLFVTQNTVGAHVKSIYSKTNCHKKDEVINLLEELKSEEAA